MTRKEFILIAGLMVFILNALFSQNKTKTYITKVTLFTAPYKVKGQLSEVTDTSLLIALKSEHSKPQEKGYETVNLGIDNIDAVKIQGSKVMTNSILIGIATGLVAGAVIGYSAGDDEPCDVYFISCTDLKKEDKAVLYGILGATIGGGVGAIIGNSIKVTIPINGGINNYRQYQNELRKYAMTR